MPHFSSHLYDFWNTQGLVFIPKQTAGWGNIHQEGYQDHSAGPKCSKLASPNSARSSLSCSSSLPSPQGPQPEENGYRKSLYSDRVHSSGFDRPARASTPTFLPLPWDLLGHHDRKPGCDNTDLSECPPSHPHVLFPQQPVLRGSLLLLCHHP